MALLFMDGFDAGDILLKWRHSGASSVSNAGGRFGTADMQKYTTERSIMISLLR